VVTDSGTGTSKKWWFRTDAAPYGGLPSAYEEIESTQNGGATLVHKDYGWTHYHNGSVWGNVYQSSALTTLNPGASYQAQSKTEQTLDAYGTVTQTKQYAYGNLTTPARTYAYTYLTGSNYISSYIRNRLVSATVAVGGGQPLTMVTNSYDSYGCDQWGQCGMTDRDTPLHDAGYDSTFTYRGNITSTASLQGSKWYSYEATGVPYESTDAMGRFVDAAPAGSTNSSLPGVLTPNGDDNLAATTTYASSWAVTSVSQASGANSATTYDSYGRPASSRIPDGAVTTYAYSYNPNTQTATLTYSNPQRWKRTTLDGFGRTVKVETGYSTTAVSVVDTEYAPCACSPLGKLHRVSQPYSPGATPVWTTYAYDGSGRTLAVAAPDNSATTYVYQGNQTTVTDPAGKWKTFTTDAFGNLIAVTEPNPGGGAVATNYTYTALNQLTRVSMPRDGYTQLRTFAWSGIDMTSATNPENGTVTYVYNADHTVAHRTDAQGQIATYSYDGYGRPAGRSYSVIPRTKLFHLGYSHWGDGSDLTAAWFMVGVSPYGNLAHSCYAYLDTNAGQMYLLNDAGTAWLTGGGAIQNSQCSINLVALGWLGNFLSIDLQVAFLAYSAPQNVWIGGTQEGDTSWLINGSWNYEVQPDQSVGYSYIYSGPGAGQLGMASFGLTGGGGATYYYTYNTAGRVPADCRWQGPRARKDELVFSARAGGLASCCFGGAAGGGNRLQQQACGAASAMLWTRPRDSRPGALPGCFGAQAGSDGRIEAAGAVAQNRPLAGVSGPDMAAAGAAPRPGQGYEADDRSGARGPGARMAEVDRGGGGGAAVGSLGRSRCDSHLEHARCGAAAPVRDHTGRGVARV
jgi:YD repeat-containing protein